MLNERAHCMCSTTLRATRFEFNSQAYSERLPSINYPQRLLNIFEFFKVNK